MGRIRTAAVGEPTLQDVRRAMFEVSGELASRENLFATIGSIDTWNTGGPARVERVLIELTLMEPFPTTCRAAKSPAFAGDLPVFVFLGAYLPSSRLDTSISRICMAYLQRFSLQLS